ncbi:MAG: phosphoglycerate dehydrogenase [Streptococcaceae bacterium]|jgi:D-3-phosphoglycerate dehydrogenase|nr:phosphoglycerate dehydrogenase [Streptococcaceae bacterium]
MVYNIKTIGNNIDAEGLKVFDRPGFAVDQVEEPDADAFICRAQKFHGYAFSDKLLAMGRAGAGFNNIPIEECASRGIVVFNAPGGNANAVKELVIANLIFGSRNLKPANKWLTSLKGTDVEIDSAVEKGKKNYSGKEIAGKTLGIIGLGNIGTKVANDAERLGMSVLGYDPYLSIEHAWDLSSHVQRVNEISEIFEKSDYITIHTPLTDETRGMYGAENFAKLKDGAIVLNFARDEITDKDAVLAAIELGKIAYFATDFGSEKFYHNEHIFLSPHLGGSTAEASLNCTRMASESVALYLTTGQIINSVNFPRVVQEMTTPFRVTLINKNVPGVVARISAAVADRGINLSNIVNRGQEDFAYTLIDLDETDEAKVDELVAYFKDNENVVRVRKLTK